MLEVVYEGNLRTKATHLQNNAKIQTDAPKDNHGKGELFSPTDLLALSAASCALTLMGIAAKRLSIDISGLKVKVSKQMVNNPVRRIGSINMVFSLDKKLGSELEEKLVLAAKTCPVHMSLHPDVKLEMTFNWGL